MRRQVVLPITVSPHRTKNFSKGVIFCPDLQDVSDGDIEEGLSDVGVVSARRINSRKAGATIPTHNIVLTFDDVHTPPEVLVGYVRVKVRPYFPAPMRCFRCLRFGHTRDHCRNRPACGNCSADDHAAEECSADVSKCVNCDASQTPHSSFYPSCPSLKREKEIIAIKVNERISFKEARDKYNAKHPKRSYAAVVGQSHTATSPQIHLSNIQQQLISILEAFGLKLQNNPGVPPTPAATATPPPTPAVPPTAAEPRVVASTQTSPGQGDGWTLVQPRHGGGRRSPSPPHPATLSSAEQPSRASASDRLPLRERPVMVALRHNEEERRAREEKRARLVERARVARLAESGAGVEAPADAACAATAGPRTLPAANSRDSSPVSQIPTGSPSPMGPPPPPPDIRRAGIPPPPLYSRSPRAETPGTPGSAPRPLEPPPHHHGRASGAWRGPALLRRVRPLRGRGTGLRARQEAGPALPTAV